MRFIPLGMFSETTKTSFPARNAVLSTSPGVKYLLTPCIFSASENTRPSKPKLSLSKSLTTFLDKLEAKFGVLSKLGMLKWATIIPIIPFSMATLNGYNSKLSKRSKL